MQPRRSRSPHKWAWYTLLFFLLLSCCGVTSDIASFIVQCGIIISIQRQMREPLLTTFPRGLTHFYTNTVRGGVLPRVVFAAASSVSYPNVRSNRIYPDESKEYSYDTDLKPFMVPWRELRETLRHAGCFTTRALPRLTTAPAADNVGKGWKVLRRGWRSRNLSSNGVEPVQFANRTDFSISPVTLPAVCRRPIVLLSGRTRDCASCNHFAAEVRRDYAAEWAYIRDYVTLVDAGDPMSEQLTRFPYPLWYDEAAMARELVLTPRFNTSAKDGAHTHGIPSEAPSQICGALRERPGSVFTAQQLADAEADYVLFNAGLRQKAALLIKAPEAQAGHQWSRLVKRTFAHPNEYVLRIIFIYPHNGSIMRDVVNEGIFDGSSPDYPHFFTNAKHFFHAVKKAVRVMEWLERFGDY